MARHAQVQLVGGPLDGHTIAPRPGKYAWVRGRVAPLSSRPLSSELRLQPGARGGVLHGGSASGSPKDGAALYEREAPDRLVYAGHRVYFCNGCGTYHRKCEGGSERRACALS